VASRVAYGWDQSVELPAIQGVAVPGFDPVAAGVMAAPRQDQRSARRSVGKDLVATVRRTALGRWGSGASVRRREGRPLFGGFGTELKGSPVEFEELRGAREIATFTRRPAAHSTLPLGIEGQPGQSFPPSIFRWHQEESPVRRHVPG